MDNDKKQKTVIRPITNRMLLIQFHLEDTMERMEKVGLPDEAKKLELMAMQIGEIKERVRECLLEKIKA